MKVILLRRKEAASTQHGKKASTQSADCCIVTMSSGGLALQVFQFRFILNPKPSDAGSRGSDWSLWVVSFGPGLGALGASLAHSAERPLQRAFRLGGVQAGSGDGRPNL